MQSDKVYYMFYKPAGYITARSDRYHKTVMEFFPKWQESNLHPVGRLDKNTEGMLIITNDGNFNQKIMHSKHKISKKYLFYAMGRLDKEEVQKLKIGVNIEKQQEGIYSGNLVILEHLILEDAITKLKKQISQNIEQGILTIKSYESLLRLLNKTSKNLSHQVVTVGEITITEGKKHQVKKMIRAIGGYVIYLKRVAIGEVCLDHFLKPGEKRELTLEEYSKIGEKLQKID